jgi:hypothetical protein
MATGYVINSGLRQMTKFGVVAMLGSAGAPALASVAVTTLAVGVVTITSRVVLNMARNGRAYKEKHGKGMSLRASFNEIYPTKTSKIIGLGAAFGGTAVGAALVEYHDYLEPLWKKCANLFESTQAPQAPIPLASAPVPPPGPATAPIPSVTPASEPPPPPVPVPAPSPESATTPIPSATPLPQAPHPPVSAPAPTPKLRALTPSAEAPSPPLAAPPAEVPPLFAHEPPPPDITPGPLPSLSDRATALLDPLKGKYPALVHQAEAFFARGGHDLQGIERMVQIVHGLSNGHGVTAASRKIAATINQTALDIAKANHLDAAHHATVKVLEANQAFFETHGIGTPRNLPDALEHAKDAGRRGRKFARYIVGTLGFKPAPA